MSLLEKYSVITHNKEEGTVTVELSLPFYDENKSLGRQVFGTDNIIDLLKEKNVQVKQTVKDTTVNNRRKYNANVGTWVFRVGPPKATKKAPEPKKEVEDKKNVDNEKKVRYTAKKTNKK